nr:AraC family transcriptional regulator [uncultured Clostridium sp.]
MPSIQKGVLEKSNMFFFANTQNSNHIFYYPLSAGHFYCNSDYRVERSRFDSILFMYVIRGSFSFTVNEKAYTAFTGDTAIIDCFHPHAYYTNDSFEAYWVHINGCNIYNLYETLIERAGSVIKYNEKAEEDIKEIYNTVKHAAAVSASSMSMKIYKFITDLFESNINKSSKDSLFLAATQYISDYYSEKLTVEKIASYVNLSPSQFSRIFKKAAGTSPYDYLLGVRITKAKEFLKNTNLPISEIAYQTGFSSESNFIYFFKNQEGISPLKFRKILF